MNNPALSDAMPFKASDLQNNTPHLVACDATTPPCKRELFICQDDVLFDTLKRARDAKSQAVWPIRGKIANVQKTNALHSGALVELMHVLFGKNVLEFKGREVVLIEDIEQIPMQYENVILALDSDHDGEHLTILLLGFFEKYLPHLFEQGRLFINMAPFQKKLSEDKTRYDFVFTPQKFESQDQAILTLAEMQAADVFEHITNPLTRRLARLSTRDMQSFHETIEIALSSNNQMRNALLKDSKPQALRTHRDPQAGVIYDIDPSQLTIDSVHSYASYINNGRALVDIASGLTSAERALMSTALQRFKDSNHLQHAFQLVGHTMLACYGALSDTQLTQALIKLSKAGLIDLVGNPLRLKSLYFKLTELGLLADSYPSIRQHITFPWPNILTKGHMGIGYGVSSSIPSHDFNGVISATLAIMDDPHITLASVMKILPHPDLTGQGTLASDISGAYMSGRGTYTVCGKGHVQDDYLIITALSVEPQILIESIKKGYLACDGIEKLISGIPVDISDNNGLRIKIPLSPHAVSQERTNGSILLEHLRKYNSFANHQIINFTVSHDREIKEFSLIGLIKAWIELREEFVMNRDECDNILARQTVRAELESLRSASTS